MEQIAYCYNDDGYYTHSEYCIIDPLESAKHEHAVFVLPANACIDAPVITEGHVARCVNGAWVDVENHVGEKGFVNGIPTEIKDYGPLPEGWSVTPPPPTADQLFAALRAARGARLADTDKMLLPDYPITTEALVKVKTYRAALRDLPDQPGAPWDGGCAETPWPELPKT